MHPIEEYPVKFNLFVDFIWIYFSDRKVLPLYEDLFKEGYISKQKKDRLAKFIKHRHCSTIISNAKLFNQNMSLRICLYITSMVIKEVKKNEEKLNLIKCKIEQLLMHITIKDEYEY